jgi:hypothetical protein
MEKYIHYVEIQPIEWLENYEVMESVIEKYYDVGFTLIGNFINPNEPKKLNLIFIRKEKD